MRYKIISITHSGRLGIRGEKYDDNHINSLIGNIVYDFSINDVDSYRPITFALEDNPIYQWWTTSPVIKLEYVGNDIYEIETVNAIYKLKFESVI